LWRPTSPSSIREEEPTPVDLALKASGDKSPKAPDRVRPFGAADKPDIIRNASRSFSVFNGTITPIQ
jgi:hypothetical protein